MTLNFGLVSLHPTNLNLKHLNPLPESTPYLIVITPENLIPKPEPSTARSLGAEKSKAVEPPALSARPKQQPRRPR